MIFYMLQSKKFNFMFTLTKHWITSHTTPDYLKI